MEKKIDFSSFCLNDKEHNFSGLLSTAYSLDKLLSMKGYILLPNHKGKKSQIRQI